MIQLNDFQIIQTLGEGNFSKTFLVESEETKSKYLVQISKSKFNNNIEQKQFINEMTPYLSLRYPSILSVIGISPVDFNNQPYPTTITDYLPSISLQKLFYKMKQGNTPTKITPTNQFIILLGISLGMKYLHANDTTHGNLNPSNIFLDNNLYPKISDFSLSKKSSEFFEKVQKYSEYTAPELFSNGYCTTESDIYSFAIIAKQLIENKRPPIAISKNINEEIKSFFHKCTSLEPSDRPTFYEICRFFVSKNFMKIFGPINYEEVIYYLDQFEEDPDTLFFQGVMMSDTDKVRAIQYYRKGINKGDSNSMNNYANMLQKGEGVATNKKEAAYYYKLAAMQGNSNAMYNYALMLDNGDGLSMNKGKALKYYKMAADNGNSSAMFNYAVSKFNGDGVAVDKEEAICY